MGGEKVMQWKVMHLEPAKQAMVVELTLMVMSRSVDLGMFLDTLMWAPDASWIQTIDTITSSTVD